MPSVGEEVLMLRPCRFFQPLHLYAVICIHMHMVLMHVITFVPVSSISYHVGQVASQGMTNQNYDLQQGMPITAAGAGRKTY